MMENVKKFDIKWSKVSWTEMKDLRHTLMQYLLHENRFEAGEDKTIEKEEGVRRYAGHAPTYQFKPSYEDRSFSTDQRYQRVCDDNIRSNSDVRVP